MYLSKPNPDVCNSSPSRRDMAVGASYFTRSCLWIIWWYVIELWPQNMCASLSFSYYITAFIHDVTFTSFNRMNTENLHYLRFLSNLLYHENTNMYSLKYLVILQQRPTTVNNIILFFLPNWCKNSLFFNTFITFLYIFRAILCSSSGGQIVLVQHLVSSLSLGDCSVHRLREVTCVLNVGSCWMTLRSFEGGSSRSHYMESSLWKRLWACRKAYYWMNEVKASDDGRARVTHGAEGEIFPTFGEGT
jgi:hypothetical protein